MRHMILVGVLVGGAAACGQKERTAAHDKAGGSSRRAVPRLRTEAETPPSLEEVQEGATRYCDKLVSCAPAAGAHEDCMGKMLSHVDTDQDRRGTMFLLDSMAPCEALSCDEMAACFSSVTVKMFEETQRHQK